MPSFHLFVNPLAGRGRCLESADVVARVLRQAGVPVQVTQSSGVDACRERAAEAVGNGQTVVAVGGDGMVRSVLAPVVEAGAPLGIVPAGRGNDFARQLGLTSDPAVAAHVLLAGYTRSVDVIDAGGEYIAGSVYAGIDSLTSQIVNRGGILPSSLHYPVAAVRALLAGRASYFEVTVDGARLEREAYMVVCANSGYYGSGMHIAPRASVDDGQLDVIIVGAAPKVNLLARMPRLYTGSHLELDIVTMLRGREVRIDSPDKVVAFGDGEPVGAVPVTARVRPEALTVLA